MKRVIGTGVGFRSELRRKGRPGRWRCFISGAILGAIPAFAGGFVVNFILTQRFGL